jgi:archaellum component FlaC
MKEMYDKETLDGVSKINGKRYDEKMIDRIADEMMMREKYIVSQYNERNADMTIDRIMETLERINTKLDKLTDTMVNVKK